MGIKTRYFNFKDEALEGLEPPPPKYRIAVPLTPEQKAEVAASNAAQSKRIQDAVDMLKRAGIERYDLEDIADAWEQ